MTIFEKSRYSVPPEDVWPFVVDSSRFVLWNRKLKIFSYTGPFREGDTFGVEYTLGLRKTACSSTVYRIQENRLLHLTHRNCLSAEARPDFEADETFRLFPKRNGTLLRHKVWVRNHGVPFYLVALITFISLVGKPQGPDDLKMLLEKGRTPRSS